MKKILAISGSTKAVSTNTLYITAISRFLGGDFEVISFPSIADIPHFNPDLDQDNPPTGCRSASVNHPKGRRHHYLYTRIRDGFTRFTKKLTRLNRKLSITFRKISFSARCLNPGRKNNLIHHRYFNGN